jgi:hypothetical protein
MNHYDATMAQTHAVGRLNIQLEAEKLMRRIYGQHRPAASVHDDVNKWIVVREFGLQDDGNPSIRLTPKGERYVRRELL